MVVVVLNGLLVLVFFCNVMAVFLKPVIFPDDHVVVLVPVI